MANYSTHLTGAAISSGLLASTLSVTELFQLWEVVIFFFVGVIGGILPDIDSDSSKSLRNIFSLLGVIASFSCIALFQYLPLMHLWAIMFAVFMFVRYAFSQAFAKLTIHRGVFHSLVAAIFFALLGIWVTDEVLNISGDFSWGVGLSILAGYITHLMLDELSSVDLSNSEIKRSFGTAMKPISISNLWGTLIFLAGSVYLYQQSPEASALRAKVFNTENKMILVNTIRDLKDSNVMILESIEEKIVDH